MGAVMMHGTSHAVRRSRISSLYTAESERVVYPDPRWFAMQAKGGAANKAPTAGYLQGQYKHETAAVLKFLNSNRGGRIPALRWHVLKLADVADRVPRAGMAPGRLKNIVARWLREDRGWRRTAKGGLGFWLAPATPDLSPTEALKLHNSPSNRRSGLEATLARLRAKRPAQPPKRPATPPLPRAKPAPGTRLEQALASFWREDVKVWRRTMAAREGAIGPPIEKITHDDGRPGLSPSPLAEWDFSCGRRL